jgi:hypothetical protein
MRVNLKAKIYSPVSQSVWDIGFDDVNPNEIISIISNFENFVLENHLSFAKETCQSGSSATTGAVSTAKNTTNYQQEGTKQKDFLDPKEEVPNSGSWAVYKIGRVQITLTQKTKEKQMALFVAPPPNLQYPITRAPLSSKTLTIPKVLIQLAVSQEYAEVKLPDDIQMYMVLTVGGKTTSQKNPYLNVVTFGETIEECTLYGKAHLDMNPTALEALKNLKATTDTSTTTATTTGNTEGYSPPPDIGNYPPINAKNIPEDVPF